jgi:predicted RecB family nuclease
MRYIGSSLSLAATDLSNFLGCRHRTALEMLSAADALAKPFFDDPLQELLRERGLAHEKAHLETLRDAGYDVVDLVAQSHDTNLVTRTLNAMRSGAEVIYQGALDDDPWYGRPDFLMRIAHPSTFGDWSYEVRDTKLTRDTRAGTILQLGLYSLMLARAQGTNTEYLEVVTPDAEHRIHRFRVDDYAAYVRLVRSQLRDTVARTPAEIAADYYPEPVEHCHICPWYTCCIDKRKADDHLSLVANISQVQRRELYDRGVRTLTALAQLTLPIPFKPARGSVVSFERAREQARLQLESRNRTPPLHELRELLEGKGLSRLPEPCSGDIFLDLEGDNIAFEGGREYLFGLVTIDANGAPEYHSFWGFNDRDERASFEAVMDLIARHVAAHPEMHVYHYAPYEVTAFKRLMGRYATRESELDAMLREGRFVDLYAIVNQSLRAGIERYSIKNLEPLYGFVRDVELPAARRELGHLVYALAIGEVDSLPSTVRDTVEGYNRDDCVSTLHLRDWLESVRLVAISEGKSIPRPALASPEAAQKISEKQKDVEVLRQALLAGIDTLPTPGTPAHGRWLLAYMLDFHRREEKPGWWKYFDTRDSSDEILMDNPDAIVGLEHCERVELVRHATTGKPTGAVIDRYRYPQQEMEILKRDDLKYVVVDAQGEDIERRVKTLGKVVEVDRINRTIDVQKPKAMTDEHPATVFEHTFVPSETIAAAIARIARDVAESASFDAANGAARALLLREPPHLTGTPFRQPAGGHAGDYAIDVVQRLDHSLLAIQGPPGSGKTFTGARMICALVAAGNRVGVLGPSHKVITNLLDAVGKEARATGVTVRISQKTDSKTDDLLPDCITALADSGAVSQKLRDREADVVGGTAWLWSREDMSASVDVLFVDEAGQLSLANAVAVSASAASMVLLGDPQQLDQPQKGTHPDGVELSALQHMLGGHSTIPGDRGIFLETTWRLAPSICDFTSEIFYERKLCPKMGLELQALSGVDGLSGSGLWYVDIDHDGRTSASDEEVDAVASLVSRLLSPGAMWIAESGAKSQLTVSDILVVSPFNAQVSRLRDRLPAGARVGTVDKFQGQAAPVVIYSMASSSPEDAPRGMEFLYSLNRLNVATSRAKCAVIIVANPRLYSPECKTPRQMKLANALCRYRELARVAHIEKSTSDSVVTVR